MKYFLTDNWVVTATFKSYGLDSSDALDHLGELTVSFCIPTDTVYSEIHQAAWLILKERLKMEGSHLKYLALSTLTLVLQSD